MEPFKINKETLKEILSSRDISKILDDVNYWLSVAYDCGFVDCMDHYDI